MTSILAGIIRAVLPALAVVADKYGIDLSGFGSPEASLALATTISIAWSIIAKVKKPAAPATPAQ